MSLSFSVISSNHFQAGTTSTSMPLQSRFINKFSCIILNCKNQIGIYHVANIIDYSLFSQGGTGAFNYISESAKGEWFGKCCSGRFFCV